MRRTVKQDETPVMSRVQVVNKVDNVPVVTLVKVDKDRYLVNHINERYVVKFERTDGKNTSREAIHVGDIL